MNVWPFDGAYIDYEEPGSEAWIRARISNIIDDDVFSIKNNNKLNYAIQNKVTEIYAALDAITLPLDEAVNQNSNDIAFLHSKFEDLRILFTVDVRSILSIIITTDTDGD